MISIRHFWRLFWHWHWQNLAKEDGKGGLNGRAWLHLYWGNPDIRGQGRKLTCLGIQWVLLRKQHSIGVSLDVGGGDGDRDVDFSLRIPYFGVYLSAEDVWPRRWKFYNPGQKYPSSREFSVKWHNLALWIALWRDPDEGYGRGGPSFWKDARSSQRHIVIHPFDLLLGRHHYEAETLVEQAAEVELPEGCYPAQVTVQRQTWTRPRWPWSKRSRISATVKIEQGLPIPGKGENGWDCDDDAYFSIGTPTATVAEAVRYAAEQVIKQRARYASADWVPAGK